MKALIINGSGILFGGRSGIRSVLKSLGMEKEMLVQKREYNNNKDKGPWGLDQLASLFKGINEKEVNEKCEEFVDENLDSDSIDIIRKIKQKGFLIVSYSSDLNIISNILMKKFGLDGVLGNELEFENGIATGKILKMVDRYDRAEKIKDLINSNNLTRENVLIIGDSVTALPSLKLGRVIAFRSENQELNKKAEFRINNINELLNIV